MHSGVPSREESTFRSALNESPDRKLYTQSVRYVSDSDRTSYRLGR